MIGYLVRHRQLGVGKILSTAHRAYTIRFSASRQTHTFSYAELSSGSGTLAREMLGVGSRCQVDSALVVIRHVNGLFRTMLEPYTYDVAFETGEVRTVSEVDIDPVAGGAVADPQSQFAGLQIQPYRLFRGREAVQRVYARLMQVAGGLRAMLGSRVDLRPHQAYVAGTVLSDPQRRYILADEVGLGKTIEAGIVIYDLLAQRPEARILILCPDALTQQWLCELYTKFGGQLFTLLDLHDEQTLDWAAHPRVIASTTMAAFQVAEGIASVEWDMLVVDEAHHLLATPQFYTFVEELSRRTSMVLMLSAIPAHERTDELLRLLALLEPELYGPGAVEMREQFAALHAQQPVIGRRLRILHRRLTMFEAGEIEVADVVAAATRLMELPVVNADEDLRARLPTTDPGVERSALAAAFHLWSHEVADRYRLSRRMLRNRRSRLVAEGEMVAITRSVHHLSYRPTLAELDAEQSVQTLLRAMSERAEPALLDPFARLLFSSTVAPVCLCALLLALRTSKPVRLKESAGEFLALGQAVGYQDWSLYQHLLLSGLRSVVDEEVLTGALAAAKAWHDVEPVVTARLQRLIEWLQAREREQPKLVLFAGYPGLLATVHAALTNVFGAAAVAVFQSRDSLEQKEAQIERFQSDPHAWLLVSDESGGEGRNFQFAAELVHVDTPWYIARVEQRIGRLDRLGRERVCTDVRSNVLHADVGVEAALVRVYDEAVGVYGQSISGLEFALREVEHTLVSQVIRGGSDLVEAELDALAQRVQQERQQDDAETVLDEASYEASLARQYRSAGRADGLDQTLEGAVTEYMQLLTDGHGARMLDTPLGRGAVWRFQPERTAFGALPVDRDGSDLLVGNHDGTFRRDVAQAMPQLKFFNVGNPLFDAIIRSLDEHVTGRTFAVELYDEAHAPWVGLACGFLEIPPQDAGAVFVPKPLIVHIDFDGQCVTDGDGLTTLRRRLTQGKPGATWRDLAPFSARLDRLIGTVSWPEVIASLVARAQEAAVRQFQDRLPTTRSAWDVRLDTIGLVSVNGRLHQVLRG